MTDRVSGARRGAVLPMSGDVSDETIVQILADIGEVVGTDGHDCNLQAGHVEVLPAENANALIERGAAERGVRAVRPTRARRRPVRY